MAYVTVPKDLTHVKSKVLFGLTKRQLVCFGGALLTGGLPGSTFNGRTALFFGPGLSFQQCSGPADDFCHAAGAAVRSVRAARPAP